MGLRMSTVDPTTRACCVLLCAGLVACIPTDPVFDDPSPTDPWERCGLEPGQDGTSDDTGVVVDRDISKIEVLFGIDVSGSMNDNQAASACVADYFIESASANGGEFAFGAVTSDPYGTHEASTRTYSDNRRYQGPPGLVQIEGSCNRVLSCSADADCTEEVSMQPCNFTSSRNATLRGYNEPAPGEPDAGAEYLKKLLFMGEGGHGCEMTLYNIYFYFYEREMEGLLNIVKPKMAVVVTDEDTSCPNDDGRQMACPFGEFEVPVPPDFTRPESTGNCRDDHINFFSQYFNSRNVVVNALLYFDNPSSGVTCRRESSEIEGVIIKGVAERTGGYVASLCDCASFEEFFDAVGNSTSALSTGLCFGNILPDPDSITVTHAQTNGLVRHAPSWPGSSGGWEIDPRMNCIVMTGEWAEVEGSFRVDGISPPVRLDANGCVPAGTDPKKLSHLRVTCDGSTLPIPRSDAHGYSVNGTCVEFHGDFSRRDACGCAVSYLSSGE